MKLVQFKDSNKLLLPSREEYSNDVTDVVPLPVWTNGEQCVSCWRMSSRERLSALLFGKVWLATDEWLTSQYVYSPRYGYVLFIDWPYSIIVTDAFSQTTVISGPATVRFGEEE